MADWSLPVLGTEYTLWRQALDGRLVDAALMFDSASTSATNIPSGAKRWNSTSSKFEKYNGSTWSDLAPLYAISISGNAATATTCSGNAATATNASQLGGYAASYFQVALGFTPVNKAGDTITGDVYVYRAGAPTTGVVFLGNTGARFLYYDGSNYQMPGSNLYINGSPAVREANVKTINGNSIVGTGNITITSGVSLDQGHGNIGSFCTCCSGASISLPMNPGDTVAGSVLNACSVNAGDGIKYSGVALSGTWRILGYYPSTSARFLALFQRIA